MKRIIVTGDTHSDLVGRFSYKKHPELRKLDNDIVIIAGDFGCPFGVAAPYYKDKHRKYDDYQLQYLQKKMEKHNSYCIAVLGNHDDRTYWDKRPLEWLYSEDISFKGKVFSNFEHYDRIFIVDEPTIAALFDKRVLLIPGGKSHDAEVILDPESPTFKKDVKAMKKAYKLWRIKDWEWWENEGVNMDVLDDMCITGRLDGHFDLVVSHEGPAKLHEQWKREGWPARMKVTAGEIYLEKLRQYLDFKLWIHGHYHVNMWTWYDDRVLVLYKQFYDATNGKWF